MRNDHARTRLGCLLENGGTDIFPALEQICREELGWDNERWKAEATRYQEIWKNHYYLPDK